MKLTPAMPPNRPRPAERFSYTFDTNVPSPNSTDADIRSRAEKLRKRIDDTARSVKALDNSEFDLDRRKDIVVLSIDNPGKTPQGYVSGSYRNGHFEGATLRGLRYPDGHLEYRYDAMMERTPNAHGAHRELKQIDGRYIPESQSSEDLGNGRVRYQEFLDC